MKDSFYKKDVKEFAESMSSLFENLMELIANHGTEPDHLEMTPGFYAELHKRGLARTRRLYTCRDIKVILNPQMEGDYLIHM